MNRPCRIIAIAAILLATAMPAQTTVPQKINYQGYLTNAAGEPLTGTIDMTFSLCEQASGGTCSWTESQSLTVNKGIFNVTLGTVNPLSLPFDVPYYLNIQVAGEQMSARQPLTSVGYAFRAGSADSVATATSGNTANSVVMRDASGNFSAGTITASVAGDSMALAANGYLITLRAPTGLGSGYALRLPLADGSAGQFMTTDGAGNLSFDSPTLPILGATMAIGDGATVDTYGTAVGVQSNGTNYGAALGYLANATTSGLYSGGVAIGYRSNSSIGSGDYSGGVAVGYMANARYNSNDPGAGAVAIGRGANAFVQGVAVGGSGPKYFGGVPDYDDGTFNHTYGYNQGVAVGYGAWGPSQGTGLGYKANGYVNGTAVGYRANSGNQGYAFAKGGHSRSMRYNEEWKGADTLTIDPSTLELTGYNKYGYGQVDFNGATSNSTMTEIFLGGTAGKRFTLQDNSAVSYTAYAVAVNTTTGDSSVWQIAGGIKRRSGAATTALIGATTALLSQTQGALTTAPTLTADTTNGSLKVTVTGIAASSVRWNVMLHYSEVRE